MSLQWRIEVSTFWQHPEMNTGRWREQVYDFTTGELIHDERSHADGQDFYNPEHSPHIYAGQEKANSVYEELDSEMDDWEPLKDIIFEGSGERLASYRLVAVGENENERVIAERDLFELYAMMAETDRKAALV